MFPFHHASFICSEPVKAYGFTGHVYAYNRKHVLAVGDNLVVTSHLFSMPGFAVVGNLAASNILIVVPILHMIFGSR